MEMARVLLWLFTLLSLRISHLNALLTLETTVNVVSSLQQYYRAGCVALLYTKDDVNNISSLVLLEKSLSTKFIPTVTLDFSSFSVNSIDRSCCGNYPFYVLPWADKNTSRELEELSARFRLSGQLWSVFLDEQITIQEFFADVAIPFDCLLLAVEAHGSVIRLTEVYRIAPGLPLRTNHIGFKGSDGRMVYSPLSFYERRSDLHGITIQGSTYKESLVESQNKHLYAVNAFLGEIFSALQVRMNFNLNMTSPSQESITSLINKLSQGQLEIGLTLITLNQKNKDKVGVTVPVLHRRVNVYVLTPERVDADLLLYLDPFSGALWVTFTIVAILVTVSLDTILRVSRSLSMEDTTPYSQWDMHFYVFSAFCQQGYSIALSSNAARLVIFTAYLTGIVLLNAYSGALVSFFSSKELSLPFNSLEDAIAKANLQFGVSAGSQEYRLLNQSKHDIRNVFFANLEKDPSLIVSDALSGLSRACASPFGFLLSSDVASSLLDNAKCKLTALPQTFYQYSLVIPIRRDSPYLGLINHNLNVLRDGGLTSRLRKLSWPVRKKAKLEEQWFSVDLQDIRPVLAILGIGGALAGMFFLLEVRRSRNTSRRGSKPSYVNTRR